jgi:chromosome segregation ATPase
MKNALAWTGWVVAVAAMAVAVALWTGGGDQGKPSEGAAPAQQGLERDLAAAQEALEATRADLAALQREHAALLEKRWESSAQFRVAESDEAGEEDSVPESPDESVDEVEGDRGDLDTRVLRAQMGLMTDIAYGALFEDLVLPEETQEQVREWMTDAATQARAAVVNAFGNGTTPAKEVLAAEKEAQDELREQLKTVLTPEELAAWEAYEQEKDLHLYWNILEGQLSMLAPGLTQENRDVARQVLAEELVTHIDALENSEEIYSMGNFNRAQSEAMQVSLERLMGVLDEDQYGHVEGFVTTANEALAEMGE